MWHILCIQASVGLASSVITRTTAIAIILVSHIS